MLRRRKLRIFSVAAASVLVLVTQLLVAASVFPSAFAIGPPPPSIRIDLHFDYDTARGFEKEVKEMGGDFGATPEFVLGRGRTGTMNFTFTAVKEDFAVMEENATASVSSILYGGTPPYKDGWGGGNSLPPGITARIVAPENITLPPGSKETVTLEISATPDAAIRSYNLDFSFRFVTPSYRYGMNAFYSTVLTVVEPASPTTITTVTSTKIACTNQTATSTRTITVTVSSNSTTLTVTTFARPNFSAPINTLTSTIKTTTEKVSDPSTYAWAISATIATAVLAIVLLLQRRRK